MGLGKRRRGLVGLGAAVLCSCWGLEAMAQLDWSASVSVSSGYTDEPSPGLAPTPDRDDPSIILQPPGPDFFFQVGPSLSLRKNTGRIYFLLAYNLAATIYAETNEATSYSNILTATMVTDLSSTTRLSIEAIGAQGQTGTFLMQAPGGQSAASSQLAGDVLFASLTARETISWQLAQRWTAAESFTMQMYFPLDAPPGAVDTISLTGNVEVGKQLSRWLLSGRLGTTFGTMLGGETTDENGNPVAAEFDEQLAFEGILGARYDLTQNWSVRGEGGVQLGVPADFSEYVLTGTGMGSIGYGSRRGRSTLTAAHGLALNVVTGSQTITDSVTLDGAMRLGPRTWRLMGASSAGYSYEQSLDITGGVVAQKTHIFNAHLELGWLMNTFTELSLRYQFSYQKPEEQSVTTANAIVEFDRHLVLFTMRLSYPPRRRTAQSGRMRIGNRIGDRSGTASQREEWDNLFNPTPGLDPEHEGGTSAD